MSLFFYWFQCVFLGSSEPNVSHFYKHPLVQTYSLLSKVLFCTFIQHLYKCIHNFPRSNFVRSFNFIIAFLVALRLTIRTRLLSKISESFRKYWLVAAEKEPRIVWWSSKCSACRNGYTCCYSVFITFQGLILYVHSFERCLHLFLFLHSFTHVAGLYGLQGQSSV